MSWKHCHSSSGFSLSQFLHVISDGLNEGECGAPAVVRLLAHTKISLDYHKWQNECFEM